MEDLYKIIFFGQLQPNIEVDEVINNLSLIFNIPKEKAEKFISLKKARVIKKNLSYETAIKYKNKLVKAGLKVEVKKNSPIPKNTISSQYPISKPEKPKNIDKVEFNKEKPQDQVHLPRKEQEVNLTTYIVRFSIIYVCFMICMGFIMALLPFDSNSGGTAASLIIAAMFTVIKFIKDHKRIPNKSEKMKLTLFSFLASWIVSIFLVGLFVAVSGEGRQLVDLIKSINITMFLGIFIVVLIVTSLISFGSLYFTYGFIAKKQFQTLQRKGKI